MEQGRGHTAQTAFHYLPCACIRSLGKQTKQAQVANCAIRHLVNARDGLIGRQRS